MSNMGLKKDLKKQDGFIIQTMLFVFITVGYFFWVMTPAEPQQRIEHACKPTIWAGKGFVALAELANDDLASKTTKGFEEINYGCRYWVWKVFYYEDWVSQESNKVK